MDEYKSDVQIICEIISEVGFYSLTSSDGCLCAHITLRYVDIDVHCWNSRHLFRNYYGDEFQCECRWAGIHITPNDPMNEEELVKIGEIVRNEMRQPDMNIKIIIHRPNNECMFVGFEPPAKGERPKELIVSAPIPSEDFDFDME